MRTQLYLVEYVEVEVAPGLIHDSGFLQQIHLNEGSDYPALGVILQCNVLPKSRRIAVTGCLSITYSTQIKHGNLAFTQNDLWYNAYQLSSLPNASSMGLNAKM